MNQDKLTKINRIQEQFKLLLLIDDHLAKHINHGSIQHWKDALDLLKEIPENSTGIIAYKLQKSVELARNKKAKELENL